MAMATSIAAGNVPDHGPPASGDGGAQDPGGRRDFLLSATLAASAAGVALAAWPFIDFMNPSKDVRALAFSEVDLEPVEMNMRITVKWRGKPVFIVRRSPEAISQARRDDNLANLIDPATDSERVRNPEWLIVIGICTHLGCIPQGQRAGELRGPFDGWFCTCHGSIYDLAGRVRRGPAPRNLDLPPYEFISDTMVRIG